MPLRLEEVFKISGVPSHTFVEPSEFPTLKVALRSPGRGLVVEGPSHIGKSTAIARGLEAIGTEAHVEQLSARKPADVEISSGRGRFLGMHSRTPIVWSGSVAPPRTCSATSPTGARPRSYSRGVVGNIAPAWVRTRPCGAYPRAYLGVRKHLISRSVRVKAGPSP
jgi:hypothetical protein